MSGLKTFRALYFIRTEPFTRICVYMIYPEFSIQKGKTMKRLSAAALALFCMAALLSGCQTNAGTLPKNRPADFDIRFSYWIVEGQENIYDTYEDTLQKDLVTIGTAAADLAVSTETLDEIYQKIRELELYAISEDLTSENLTVTDEQIFVTPCTEYEIKFTVNGTEYTVTGDETASSYTRRNSDADRFWTFKEYMQELYRNTEEFHGLPDAEGAYS